MSGILATYRFLIQLMIEIIEIFTLNVIEFIDSFNHPRIFSVNVHL
jgi:hypothetical protein